MSRSIHSRRLANIDADGWQLESAERRHAESPETFWIPDRKARESLRVGQLVQLLFQIAGTGDNGEVELSVERMWVEVEGKLGDLYVGCLRNQPATIDAGQGLDFKMKLAFLAEHVIDIRDGYE
jgi:hypothetical protein